MPRLARLDAFGVLDHVIGCCAVEKSRNFGEGWMKNGD